MLVSLWYFSKFKDTYMLQKRLKLKSVVTCGANFFHFGYWHWKLEDVVKEQFYLSQLFEMSP